MGPDRKEIDELYRRYMQYQQEELQLLEREVREEQTMPWIRREPKPEELPDENVLAGLRDVQRVVLRRMRLRTLRLVLLWRRRGSADFRMAARELYHTMKPFRVPKHHDEE